MPRLFTALELPDEARASLANLRSKIQTARWLPSENLHITLCFLGEVNAPLAQTLDEALTRIRHPQFSLTCAGATAFGKHPSHSLCCGIAESPALIALQKANAAAVRSAGLQLERRRFRPHITLARTKRAPRRQVAAWLQAHALFRSAPFLARHFTLFSSRLDHSGATYRVEHRYPLQPTS